ncbi:MAG: hypothetical protein C0501_26975 [Isosphaera sp.]|nr:hypothetical protein [Isosphaera sp.]
MGVDFNAFAERRGTAGWGMCLGEPKRGKPADVLILPCVGMRNKVLFSILGAWDEGLAPVVPERGLPKDLSPQGRERAEWTVGRDGFCGHSWLLASELAAFPWSSTLVKIHGRRQKVSYAELCEEFLTTTLPVLTSLGPPDAVRMVFWIDF